MKSYLGQIQVKVFLIFTNSVLQEKERSVLDTQTDAQAILDLIGKERKSEGLREPEDSD